MELLVSLHKRDEGILLFSPSSLSAFWNADVMAGALATISDHGMVGNTEVGVSAVRSLGLQNLYGVIIAGQDCQLLGLVSITEK